MRCRGAGGAWGAQVMRDRKLLKSVLSDLALLHSAPPSHDASPLPCQAPSACLTSQIGNHCKPAQRAECPAALECGIFSVLAVLGDRRWGTHAGRSAGGLRQAAECRGSCAGMSVRLVLVLGVRQLMDQLLTARGITPTFAAGYRISDSNVMLAAAEATGAARVQVEAALSKVPLMPPSPSRFSPLPAQCANKDVRPTGCLPPAAYISCGTLCAWLL